MSLASTLIVAGAGFGFVVVCTDILGRAGFGTLLLALSLYSMPAFLLTSLVERPAFLHLSRIPVGERDGDVRRLTGVAFARSLLIGALIAMLGMGVAPWLEDAFAAPELADWMRMLAPVPILFAGWNTLASCAQARQRVALYALGGAGLHAGLQLALAAVAAMLVPEPPALAAALVTANALTCLFLAARSPMRISGLAAIERGDMRYGAELSLTRLLTHAETTSDVWLVGLVTTPEGIALYGVARRIARLLNLGKQAVDALQIARIEEQLFDEGAARARLEREVQLGRLAGFGACAVAMTGLVLFAPTLLAWLGGYGAAAPILVILIAAQVISIGFGAVGQLVAMTGRAHAVMASSAVAAVMFVTAALVLGGWWGAIGVALAATLAAGIRNALLLRASIALTAIRIITWPTLTMITTATLVMVVVGMSETPWAWTTLALLGLALAAFTAIEAIVVISRRAPVELCEHEQ